MHNIQKILLIDDNPNEHELFLIAMGNVNKSIECCFANGVVDAFSLLENIKGTLPDLIFLDVNMPLHSGRDCLRALKQSKRFSHIPVIMYTVQDLTREKKEFKEWGATFFLRKPELKELTLTLRFLLDAELTKEESQKVGTLLVSLV